jgi:hypothetical protein
MVAAMIDEMAERLAQAIGERLAGDVAIVDDAIEIGGSERRDEGEEIAVEGLEAGAEGGETERGEIGRRGGRRAAVPALVPDPFGGEDVNERIADGGETGAEIASEILGGERGAGVEGAAVGPGVELEERAKFFGCHAELSAFPV